MSVLAIAVRDFRNIESADLSFGPGLNLITGANGAGKTSLLEALYFLGRAQSFRTTHPAHLIRSGADRLVVTGRLDDGAGGALPVGVERSRTEIRARLGGQPVQRLSELVSRFPYQLLTPDSHALIEAGPRARRRFLDWGVFHVEQSFYPTWQRFTRALRQRNAALRQRASAAEVRLWDAELTATAARLDDQRRAYVQALEPAIERYLADFVELPGLRWAYRRGWPEDRDYADVLAEGWDGDLRQGFTRSGPHRADFVPLVGGATAHERVSRGQQKLLVAAMTLAQAFVYQAHARRPCLFLVDDLASELDPAHRERVMRHLQGMRAQVFLTAIEDGAIDTTGWAGSHRFHVEHGHVREVVY